MDPEDEYEDYLIGSYVPIVDLGVQTLRSIRRHMVLVAQTKVQQKWQSTHTWNGIPVTLEVPSQPINPAGGMEDEEQPPLDPNVLAGPIKINNSPTGESYTINLPGCSLVGQLQIKEISSFCNDMVLLHRRPLKANLHEATCPLFAFRLYSVSAKTKLATELMNFEADDFEPIARTRDAVFGIVHKIHLGTQKKTKTLWVFPPNKPLFAVDPASAFFTGGSWLYEWSPSTAARADEPVVIKRRHLQTGIVKGEISGICKSGDLHTIDCFGDGILIFSRKLDEEQNAHFEVVAVSKTLQQVVHRGSLLHQGLLLKHGTIFKSRFRNSRFACFLTLLDGFVCLNLGTVYKTQAYFSVTKLFADTQGSSEGTILGLHSRKTNSRLLELWLRVSRKRRSADQQPNITHVVLKF